ncbi:hypothetical protein AGMMS49573_10710 [Endomicrobiia bacterium]|nr:hypothetical protein AGMMS49532_10610 [Endomicrobiia bacterium]GHT18035.1 hypothetical protein AGMMS49573_10710 [Endomicrobiia bacterium]
MFSLHKMSDFIVKASQRRQFEWLIEKHAEIEVSEIAPVNTKNQFFKK